ncbi:hypothetical protein [Pseudomonas sp. dw_358]|uniref:hypothetical protein n=1 Tax=Pseudomonas sp. dw_358 TaxID=2720083 RepID=UPI001BD2C1AE|nr:hypothetical protein [Pseudomonas sp. dw_358]
MTSRAQFEQAYAEDNNCTLSWVEGQRMASGRYLDLYLDRAWHWWQRGQEAA